MNISTQHRWLALFVITALSVFALKVYLAYSTAGAADMTVWKDFLSHIHQCGVCVYQTGGLMLYPGGQRVNPFNHPPFIIHYLRFLGSVSDSTGLEFKFVFRVLTSIFDLGTVIIVYVTLNQLKLFKPFTFLLYVLAPATAIISGYHGNTDTLMLFFILLGAALVRKRPAWLAGLAFGMACNIKIVPIIFAPAFLFYLADARKRLTFFAAAGGLVLLASLPFIIQDPLVVVREVASYAGFPGRWGWTQALFAITGPTDTFRLISRLSAYLLLLYILWVSRKMNVRDRPQLFLQLGFIAFLFMSFTPSWGSNYLAWLDPFPIALSVVPTLLYYGASGALLIYLYFVKDDESTRLMGICWIAVLVVNLFYIRRFRKKQPDV